MFAITGITGKVGGEVARKLLAGNQPVRAVMRDLRKGEAWAQLGCDIVGADITTFPPGPESKVRFSASGCEWIGTVPICARFLPAKPQTKQLERQSMLYRSARVKAVFERDAPQSSDGWKNVKYFDSASGKQLNSQQVLKRLPCAVSAAPSP